VIFWLKLNIVAVAVTLGRRELKTLKSVHAAGADLTDRRECLHKGVGENESRKSWWCMLYKYVI
jgi:hypothetical protein